MLETSPGKTPVSLLQEICTRKNLNPKYELLQVEGAVHDPRFQYRLSLDYNGAEFEQTGTGRSKKEAKHNTAMAMLTSMGILPKDSQGVSSRHDNNDDCGLDNDDLLAGLDGDLGGNPVGLLQELCMKMKHPPPTYEVHSEEGLPHERIFALACRVGDHYVEIGRGKSKKLAKRQAAALMAERLKNIPSEIISVYDFEEDDDKICERMGAIKKLSACKSEGETMLFKCQNIARTKFSSLQDPELWAADPIKFLSGLEDSYFKVIYIDFDEISSTDMYQCFVQITSDPPLVGIGEGPSRAEAKTSAAFDAIHIFSELLASGS